MRKHREAEYKEYVCRLVVEEKQKMSEVSRNLDIPYGTLRRWIDKYKQSLKDPAPSLQDSNQEQNKQYLTPSDYHQELKQQEKEIQKLQEENEILKKAMHVFTKNRE